MNKTHKQVGSDRIHEVASGTDESVHYEQSADALEDSGVVHAVQEYLAGLEAGHKPDRQQFLQQYPAISKALAECLDALEFVHSAAPRPEQASVGGQAGASSAQAESPMEGLLGDFRILREIGRGGMGVVYEAQQISLKRRVALKVLPFAAVLDPRQLQRFQNEAQTAACLHHTSIVPVYAVGCERGVHFFAMQYIEGLTLADLIQELQNNAQGPMTNDQRMTNAQCPSPNHPVPDADVQTNIRHSTLDIPWSLGIGHSSFFRAVACLGVQGAEALDHAHQQGILHRDIKPANLLLDVRSNLWITDFGLARVQKETRLSMTGDLVGTLRYMSPEQALAKREVVDHRSDIYSLGVTLYELVTLEPPFQGNDREELLRQIAFDEPRLLRRLNRPIPSELETIVLKAMEKNPAERYATAQELADDLRRFLEDKPIRAKRPTLVQRASRWSRRHKPLMGAALVVGFLGALFAVTIGLWLTQQRTETAGRVAEALRRASELQTQSRWPEALEAVQRADELLKVGIGSAELRQRVRGALADLTMILRLDDIRQEEEPVRNQEQDSVREGGFHDLQGLSFLYGEAFRNYGIDVDALQVEEAAQRISARPIHVELAAALDHWAHVRLIKMAGTSDEPNWKHLVEVASAADQDDPWRTRLREHLGRSPEDKKILQELAASPELGSQSALTLHLLGNCLGDAGAVDAAISVLRQAQQWHPENFWITKDVADYLQLLGQPGEALRFRTAAMVLRPHSARMHNKLGDALLNQGALKQAIAAFDEGQRFVSEDFGIDVQWGAVLKKKGALEEAVAAFHEASRLKPDEAGIYINWASALQDQGALDKAIAAYDQSIATVKRVRARKTRPASIGALLHSAAYGRANALLRLGRFEEAGHTYQEALELEPSYHWSWFCGAALRLYLGDVEGYRSACREMLARFSQTDDPKIAWRVAKTCLLAPDAVSDLRPVLQLAERAVTGTQQHWAYRSFLLAKGMADYRSGNFANAIHWINQSISLRPAPWYYSNRYLVGMAQVFLTMAHHRLGHAKQARQALHQATLLTNPSNGTSGENEYPEDWYHWMRLHIVRQEAERLLKG
jgi:serine/threonine protein kinase/Flp pilus assembly protein TadD